MDLNETLAFVAVVRARSFTAAGARLGVPKSTLSRQVSRLEERLGARLLQRTTRKLSLTEMGEAYFQRCARAIEDIEEAERVAHDVAGEPRGTLKVSVPFDFARDFLAAWMPELRARYPELELVFVMTQARVDLVAEGIDVALRGGALPDAGFVARRLAKSELGLYASAAYLKRRGVPRTLEELKGHDCILFGLASGMRLEGPDGPVELKARAWLTANEFGFLREQVRAGLGIGLLVSPLIGDERQLEGLTRVLPDYGVSEGGLYAVYPSRHHLSPKVRVFVDFLVEKLSERPRTSTSAAR